MSKRRVFGAVVTLVTIAVLVGGCAAVRGTARRVVDAPFAVRSAPAADWPTGSSRPATVTILLPEDRPLRDDDVTAEVFGDASLARTLEGQVASTLFAADSYESDQYLTAAIAVIATTRAGSGADVYVAYYEQWWQRGVGRAVAASAEGGLARLRLHREGDGFELSGVDRPGDGSYYPQGLESIMPDWVRARAEQTRSDMAPTFERLTSQAAERWIRSEGATATP